MKIIINTERRERLTEFVIKEDLLKSFFYELPARLFNNKAKISLIKGMGSKETDSGSVEEHKKYRWYNHFLGLTSLGQWEKPYELHSSFFQPGDTLEIETEEYSSVGQFKNEFTPNSFRYVVLKKPEPVKNPWEPYAGPSDFIINGPIQKVLRGFNKER